MKGSQVDGKIIIIISFLHLIWLWPESENTEKARCKYTWRLLRWYFRGKEATVRITRLRCLTDHQTRSEGAPDSYLILEPESWRQECAQFKGLNPCRLLGNKDSKHSPCNKSDHNPRPLRRKKTKITELTLLVPRWCYFFKFCSNIFLKFNMKTWLISILSNIYKAINISVFRQYLYKYLTKHFSMPRK